MREKGNGRDRRDEKERRERVKRIKKGMGREFCPPTFRVLPPPEWPQQAAYGAYPTYGFMTIARGFPRSVISRRKSWKC